MEPKDVTQPKSTNKIELVVHKVNLQHLDILIALNCSNFPKFASHLPQSSYTDHKGYGFCKCDINLGLGIDIDKKLQKYIGELFNCKIYWWISCGRDGSNTPAHDDPLEISRGFLAVVKGVKAVLVWSREKGEQKELIYRANEYLFKGKSKGDGFKDIGLDNLKSEFAKFNQKYGYKGEIVVIHQNQAITFNARQKHAVVNYGEDTVGIAGKIWRKDNTQKFMTEIYALAKAENPKGDNTGSTSAWVIRNYERIYDLVKGDGQKRLTRAELKENVQEELVKRKEQRDT